MLSFYLLQCEFSLVLTSNELEFMDLTQKVSTKIYIETTEISEQILFLVTYQIQSSFWFCYNLIYVISLYMLFVGVIPIPVILFNYYATKDNLPVLTNF